MLVSCVKKDENESTIEGMVLIPGGELQMGGRSTQASPDEFPKKTIKIEAFLHGRGRGDESSIRRVCGCN